MRRLLHAIVGTTLFASLSPALQAEPLEIWISSFQDKVYYEDMTRLYQKEVDQEFEANVHAYGFREMPDKLAVAIKTGVNPPDVVQLDEVLFGTYLGGKIPFLDLTERVKKAGLNENLLRQRLELFTYQGKIRGLSQSLSAQMLYYRTDLFAEHGLTPEDFTTWEEVIRQGEKLAEKRQALIALDPTYFEILLRQRGTDLFGPDGKPFPDRDIAIDTLRWLRELHKKEIGVMPERGSIFDPVFFNTLVASGEVLCIIGADWYGLDMIQQFTPDLKGKWGIMPLPTWKLKDGSRGPRTSAFAGQGLLIYNESKKQEAAWKFIEFVMTNKEANAQRFLGGNSFPAYKPAWKDERLLKNLEFFDNQSMGKLLVELAPEMPFVAMQPGRPKAVFLFQESFFSALMYDQISPEGIVDKMTELLTSE